MQATTPFPTLKKAESFQILEDRPECRTPIDAIVQAVIRPAMLIENVNGKKFLFYEINPSDFKLYTTDSKS